MHKEMRNNISRIVIYQTNYEKYQNLYDRKISSWIVLSSFSIYTNIHSVIFSSKIKIKTLYNTFKRKSLLWKQ